MKIANVPVYELKAGMAVFEDVFNLSGVVIISRGSTLDDFMIEKLKRNNIDRVKIKFTSVANTKDALLSYYSKEKIEAIERTYTEKVGELTGVLKSIGRGENVEIGEIKNISKEIMNEFDILSDLLNFIHILQPLDDYTYGHSLNVSIISMVIGGWLGLTSEQLDELATAGLLHDVGKTGINENILGKPTKLTKDEFEEMKKHTVMGYKMVENIKGVTENIRYAVLMHHEKIDGSGYPFGLKEKEIPLFAKIIAIADIYDAMTSSRTYRERMCPFEVIRNFEMHTFGKLDTLALTTFLQNIANAYKGDFVELSNGEIGEVIFINPSRVWQPIVRVGDNFIDLSKSKDVSIKEIV